MLGNCANFSLSYFVHQANLIISRQKAFAQKTPSFPLASSVPHPIVYTNSPTHKSLITICYRYSQATHPKGATLTSLQVAIHPLIKHTISVAVKMGHTILKNHLPKISVSPKFSQQFISVAEQNGHSQVFIRSLAKSSTPNANP